MDKEILLKEILTSLANDNVELDDGKIEEYVECLRKLYDNDYRHLYSQIFAIIVSIDENYNDSNVTLEYLTENIRIIFDYCEKTYGNTLILDDRNFFRRVKKLYDHINLDVSRINYVKALQDKNNVEMFTLSNRIESAKNELNEKIKEAQDSYKEIDGKIGYLQRDYIAILGIFASIVVTFVAGISLANSTLSALGNSKDNFYTLVFLVLLVAMFMFNTLIALFEFLLKITNKDITYKVMNLSRCDINIIFTVLIVVDYLLYVGNVK